MDGRQEGRKEGFVPKVLEKAKSGPDTWRTVWVTMCWCQRVQPEEVCEGELESAGATHIEERGGSVAEARTAHHLQGTAERPPPAGAHRETEAGVDGPPSEPPQGLVQLGESRTCSEESLRDPITTGSSPGELTYVHFVAVFRRQVLSCRLGLIPAFRGDPQRERVCSPRLCPSFWPVRFCLVKKIKNKRFVSKFHLLY